MALYNFSLDVTGYPAGLTKIFAELTSSDGWVTGGEDSGTPQVSNPPDGGTVTLVFDQNVVNHGAINFSDTATVWFLIRGHGGDANEYPQVLATIGPYLISDVGTVA